MYFDLMLNPKTRDLSGTYALGTEEILQRLSTRLHRELGEWFLATQAGIPWFQSGQGILGNKDSSILVLRIRKEILATTGITKILSLNALYDTPSRTYSVYARLLVDTGSTISFWLTEEGSRWLQE
jgi:hypothetical protein